MTNYLICVLCLVFAVFSGCALSSSGESVKVNGPGVEDLVAKSGTPSKEFVYKKIVGRELKIYLFDSQESKSQKKRPAIVFFHGGAWRQGDLSQFYPQSEYFASRGMVAFCVQYRLTPQGFTVADAVSDAKSAIRWVRAHAEEFGSDPNRIAAGGGSAGGHLAGATGVVPNMESPGDDLAVPSKPNLLVLYNPAFFHELAQNTIKIEYFDKNTPPMLLMYGTKDEMLAYGKECLEQSKKKKFSAELFTAADVPHGFFNKQPWLNSTSCLVDQYLTKHSYIKGKPTISSKVKMVEVK